MCGRYSLFTEFDEVEKIIKEAQKRVLAETGQKIKIASGEIYPQSFAPVLLAGEEGLESHGMVWGFPGYPDREKPEKKPRPLINTKSETADKLFTWKDSYRKRRCLIPSTGFYEWGKAGRVRSKFLFMMPDSELTCMAGIYKPFEEEDGSVKGHYSILTTAANSWVNDIHSRMPVVLHPAEYDQWLTGDYAALMDRSFVTLLKEEVA